MPSPHVHIPYNRIGEYIGFIREKRLDLEIYFNSDELDSISSVELDELKSRLDYGPSLSFHGPFMDLSPGAVDLKIRQISIDRFSKTLDIAEVLWPKAVVFHSGYEKWRFALKTDVWLEKSLSLWEPLNKRASEAGVKIAIENIFEEDPYNLELLMKKMNSENFGICFDTGHFHLFSKKPLEKWLEVLGPHIVELHLHDNDGSSDQHRPMGEGGFDFRKFFGLFKKTDCVFTLEAHSPESVLKSLSYLQGLGL